VLETLHSEHGLPSYLASIDPRARMIAAVVLSIVIALEQRLSAAALALAAAVLAAVLARLSPVTLLKRLAPLEVLLAALIVLLSLSTLRSPLSTPHSPLLLGCLIALKANAVVLGLLALSAGMDAMALGHALGHLGVPRKLTHLSLLSIRYLDVLHREYRRLRAAMKVRCFRPRADLHTYRSYGYLVGMLLVHSFDRSERILAAMKCRGFRGRFHVLDHFSFSPRRDLPFCGAAALFAAGLLLWGWA
jgi:cobalt/nickel transport system permease protein